VSAPQPLVFRKGLDMKEAVAGELAAAYHSTLVDQVRASNFRHDKGRLTLNVGLVEPILALDLGMGKPAAGRIALRAARAPGGLVVEIEDDGRGVDWPALRRSAAARGISAGAGTESIDLLFQDGVSSAGQVTSTSGRGVGMGALRAAVESLGGQIAVHSARGAGTRLTITFAL